MLRKEQLTLNAFCGGISEIEILWDTNFDVSIRLAATYWISIVRRQSWRSNWMVAGTTTG
jgi:hypothetical protein